MEPLFEQLKSKAVACPQRIVLPESLEPRTLRAADRIIAEGIANVYLIGNREEILTKASELELNNIGRATFINPEDAEAMEPYAQLFYELRK